MDWNHDGKDDWQDDMFFFQVMEAMDEQSERKKEENTKPRNVRNGKTNLHSEPPQTSSSGTKLFLFVLAILIIFAIIRSCV